MKHYSSASPFARKVMVTAFTCGLIAAQAAVAQTAAPGPAYPAKPGGNASSGHLAGELFMYKTGVKLLHIPFKGGGPAVISSVSGETTNLFTSVPAAVHHLKARRLIGLGVSSSTRDPAVPDIPTIAEAGVAGYEFYDWQGVVAPAGTPRAAINRVQQELVKALAVPEIRTKIAGVGARTIGSTPEELGAFIKKELETWSVVVKATGIRMD